ncbi:MAG: T9SS type A sorting domain-containing protein, partial [Bacteroidota bacterium]
DRTYSVLSVNFPGNSSFQVQKIKRIKLPIPADAPDGTYNVTIYAADDISNGGQIYDTDMFSFTLGPVVCSGPCATGDVPVSTSKTLVASEAGPNPFSTSTTIRYELTNDAEVDLRVFDVRGREVAALASGVQSAGAHTALFAADDLPSGVYMWRLAVDGQVTTGRVTLAR